MSVEHVAVVLHHSKAQGTARLVLLGIANHMGDGGAWPSIATLAKYAGGVAPRSVQRAIEKLRGDGELRVHLQAGGLAGAADHTRPNRYDVLVTCPPWCDRSPWHRDTRAQQQPLWKNRVTPASPPDASVTPPPDASVTPPPDASVTRNTNMKPADETGVVVGASTTDRACSICSLVEAECQRRAPVSGHAFTPKPRP